VQGLERQGLRRHLPSRSSVRAELRDGNTRTCCSTVILKELCACCRLFPSDRSSPLLTFRRREAEEKGSLMRLFKRRATERFNPELKLPRLMSAKKLTQPRPPARYLPRPAQPGRWRRARVTRPCSFLDFSN
jgi:hypothetical protein